MHEEGMARLAGAIEERQEIVNKINALQKKVEAGEINVFLFYKEVIAMKHSIENKVM